MLALALALALAARPAAAQKPVKPAKAQKTAPDATGPAAAPAGPSADAPVQAAAPGPLDPLPGNVTRDVMGFLSVNVSTASQDGGVRLDWSGPGGAQLKMSWDLLERRNEQVAIGDMMTQSLMQVVRRFYETSGGNDPGAVRERLQSFSGTPLDEAKAAYVAAVELEGKRLFYVEKAIAAAAEASESLPGVSADLVERRYAALKDGRIAAAVNRRIGGYRSLALGLVAYIDGDALVALEKMKLAGEELPDEPIVHAYLGSLYYLFQQSDRATAAWKRSLELDPTNETVKAALRDYGRRGR